MLFFPLVFKWFLFFFLFFFSPSACVTSHSPSCPHWPCPGAEERGALTAPGPATRLHLRGPRGSPIVQTSPSPPGRAGRRQGGSIPRGLGLVRLYIHWFVFLYIFFRYFSLFKFFLFCFSFFLNFKRRGRSSGRPSKHRSPRGLRLRPARAPQRPAAPGPGPHPALARTHARTRPRQDGNDNSALIFFLFFLFLYQAV